VGKLQLSSEQYAVIKSPIAGSIFLEGPAGSGKTTTGVMRLLEMVNQGVPAGSFLIIAPQRSLADPYLKAIESPDFPTGSPPAIFTISGLAQRMIDLFWPVISPSAGFRNPSSPPKFLTLETAQYFMARIVNPMINTGAFESLTIDPNRLFSQLLDNLNKAAVVGFSHETISERLKSAWMGDPGQLHIFDQTQVAVNNFRTFCLESNLLDFSLQIEIFHNHLWPSTLIKSYLRSLYKHLIFENLEEDVPVTHDLIAEWLPDFESSLLLFDQGGGFRTFMGADPQSGLPLKSSCQTHFVFSENFTLSKQLSNLDEALSGIIQRDPPVELIEDVDTAFEISDYRFISDMVNGVCVEVKRLVDSESVSPSEIVVLSPFLSDALRFSLVTKLNALNINSFSFRPSRSLGSEPTTQCLLTLAKIAHPQWGMVPSIFDLRSAFLQTIAQNDLNRSDLLARIVAPSRKKPCSMGSFKTINPDMQARITFTIGNRFEFLREWLQSYISADPEDLDIFLSRLFGEVLSQKGIGFHDDFEAARFCSQLIVSIQKFRRLVKDCIAWGEGSLGKEYVQMVESGVLAAQFYADSENISENAVLLAPAYTFLMSNRSVQYQFWLGAGSLSWWQRLYQPLTQPYILNRGWFQGKKWTDADEYNANQKSMARLVSGLLHHCRRKIYFANVGLNESGIEERGPLLQSLQTLNKRILASKGDHV
jgi:hypothetical protein